MTTLDHMSRVFIIQMVRCMRPQAIVGLTPTMTRGIGNRAHQMVSVRRGGSSQPMVILMAVAHPAQNFQAVCEVCLVNGRDTAVPKNSVYDLSIFLYRAHVTSNACYSIIRSA